MWIEGTPWSREIHQTRPRAPFAGATYGGAARTASTGLRRPGRCRGGGGVSGPRIKYHPRYVPFENATSFSILSAFCSFASRRSLGLSLSLSGSLTYSFFFLLPRILSASLPRSARVVIRILKFDGSSDAAPMCMHPGFHRRVFKGSLMECIGTLEMQNRHERILKFARCLIRHSGISAINVAMR